MKHAKIYVIVLYKCEWNGREPYYQRKTGVQVYTNSLRQLLMEISESLPILSESGSEVSHFIPEPRNFAKVIGLSEDTRKPWIKSTLKEIHNLISNRVFLVDRV